MWSTKLGKFPRFGCTAITNWHDREYCKHATNSNKLINLEFLVLSQPTKYRRTIHEHTVHQQQGRIAVLQRWALNTSSSSAGYLLFINYLNQIMIFRCMREHILYVTIFVGFCGTQNRVHWTLHCLFFRSSIVARVFLVRAKVSAASALVENSGIIYVAHIACKGSSRHVLAI